MFFKRKIKEAGTVRLYNGVVAITFKDNMFYKNAYNYKEEKTYYRFNLHGGIPSFIYPEKIRFKDITKDFIYKLKEEILSKEFVYIDENDVLIINDKQKANTRIILPPQE